MPKSTKKSQKSKPKKPYPDFPLFPHASGRWAKKIRGKFCYFGKVADDPNATEALERFKREWPYLKDGRTPPSVDVSGGCEIGDLCNLFLNAKRAKLESGELGERSWADYYRTCKLLVDHFGKRRRVDDLRPDDFQSLRAAVAKRGSTVTLRNEVNRCRVVFKFAYDQRLIPQPVHYGQSFARPSAKMLRRARNAKGVRMFEADEIRKMLDAADPVMRAMILLAVNCGFGNTDIATLPQAAVDLESGWINYPRPKTEIPRRIPLWPETVEALQAAIQLRPKPADKADADLCFLTRQGRRWVRIQPRKDDPDTFVALDALSQAFRKLLRKIDINGERGFYCFRRTFETMAGESKDQVAVDSIMGHVDNSMAATYRQRISDERLRAVVGTVRHWLFQTL